MMNSCNGSVLSCNLFRIQVDTGVTGIQCKVTSKQSGIGCHWHSIHKENKDYSCQTLNKIPKETEYNQFSEAPNDMLCKVQAKFSLTSAKHNSIRIHLTAEWVVSNCLYLFFLLSHPQLFRVLQYTFMAYLWKGNEKRNNIHYQKTKENSQHSFRKINPAVSSLFKTKTCR